MGLEQAAGLGARSLSTLAGQLRLSGRQVGFKLSVALRGLAIGLHGYESARPIEKTYSQLYYRAASWQGDRRAEISFVAPARQDCAPWAGVFAFVGGMPADGAWRRARAGRARVGGGRLGPEEKP